MRTVTIAGAGFAGLTLAHYLVKEGFHCVIHERQDRTGGLIGTTFKDYGQAEWAANALLANAQVEDLFSELNVEFADRSAAAKKRYIFWEEPKRWPLTWPSSWLAARRLLGLYLLGKQDLVPDAGESVADWCERAFNNEILERMVAPALQGIYAGDVHQMSATLLFKSMTAKRPEKRALKGSVSPLGGMGELLSALTKTLIQTGRCEIHLKSGFTMPEYVTTPLVLATSAWGASEILANSHPEISRALKVCPSIPLVRTTVFFPKHPSDIEGFGCLFPTSQKFSSLGVLFDSSVFPSRSNVRSESWMLGGAMNPEIVTWSDEQILQIILKDRERLVGVATEPLQHHIQRWPRSIPHYTCAWESALKSLRVAPPLYLHGNYLGQIGLARILERSMTLAQNIRENYGE